MSEQAAATRAERQLRAAPGGAQARCQPVAQQPVSGLKQRRHARVRDHDPAAEQAVGQIEAGQRAAQDSQAQRGRLAFDSPASGVH